MREAKAAVSALNAPKKPDWPRIAINCKRYIFCNMPQIRPPRTVINGAFFDG